jgi:superfamily II DNA or RNA helicase
MIPTLGKITPYPFQWEVITNIKNHIRKQLKREIKPTPAYINCYVSAGKTIIAGAVANHCHSVGAKLLILARTGELVDQDQQEVWNMDSPCSIFSASLGRKSTHFSTVVGTEGTVANALDTKFTEWVPHIIIIDENHQVPWQDVLDNGDSCYSKIINHFQRLNPNVCIIGMTGSPYRGIESIRGPFWKEELKPAIDRKFLVENEYIVPTIFGYGHDDVQYDLKKSNIDEVGTKDFSNSQLEELHDQMSLTTTQLIMREVMEKTKDRLCVLITCAGGKHCEEAVAVLPDDEYAIITDKTSSKLRFQILSDHKAGLLNSRGTFRYKYIAQIGCLTTGINLPLLDTSVLLRPIGSLTLLTQLLGRGMRLLKSEHAEAGYSKHDHLALDYSGTMAAMHQMFDDPFLEDAVLAKSKEQNMLLECPDCRTMNSEHARRCIGPDSLNNQPDDRCGYFWQSRKCEDQLVNGLLKAKGCGCDNDTAARECRNCHVQLIDPNAKLTNKSYDAGDWKPVLRMNIEVDGKNQDGITVTYWLDVFDENGKQEVAKVNFWAIKAGGKRTWTSNFVRRHINGYSFQQKILGMTPFQVLANKAMFDKPIMITHRINEKGKSIVHGLKFNSGKTMKGDKMVNAND